jgi:hypothetical protein
MKQIKNKKKTWIIVAVVAVIIVALAIYWLSLPPKAAPGTNNIPPPGSSAPEVPAAPLPVAATCTDSNASLGANAIYTQGTVVSVDSTGNTQKLTDECADATHLVEYVCYESPVGSGHYASGRKIISCANGCANGVCKR